MTLLSYSKTKKASSLLEVLIVLGIISTALVSAMGVLTNSMIQVANNEIEDAVNLVLVQGLELMKSPAQVKVSALPSTSASYYSLTKTQVTGTLTYTLTKQTGGVLTDCIPGSKYIITDLKDLGYGDIRMCLQAEIRQIRLQDNKPVYEIISRIFYYLGGQLRGTYLKGYRFDGFSL